MEKIKKIGRVANWLLLPVLIGYCIWLQINQINNQAITVAILANQHAQIFLHQSEVCQPRVF